MPWKIRSIELIKHNPKHFALWPYDLGNIYTILGGWKTLTLSFTGSYVAYAYYLARVRHNPITFYAGILVSSSRLGLGFATGIAIGYLKFGDRQRLHNAWVAERLKRRYPESQKLSTTDLWQFKGKKADWDFYRWT